MSQSDDLLLYLKMDKIVGGKIKDIYDDQKDGTIHGTPKIIKDDIFGHCLDFNGITDYLVLPQISGGIKSISMWVNISTENNTSSWHYLVDGRQNTDSTNAYIGEWVAIKSVSEKNIGSSRWSKTFSDGVEKTHAPETVNLVSYRNRWFHIYLELSNTLEREIVLMAPFSKNSERLKGKIANVRIYSEALKNEDIWNDMVADVPSLEAFKSAMNDNEKAVEVLWKTKLHSVFQITAIPKSSFVKRYKDAFGDDNKAKQTYDNALARKTALMLHHVSLLDHTGAHYRNALFNNVALNTDDMYGHLPTYQALFGGLDFCTCEHCRSIYSPAAYLVDLWRLKQNTITVETGKKDAFSLENRRPDLEQVLLNCENTDTLIPKLDIVNRILEDRVFKKLADETSTANEKDIAAKLQKLEPLTQDERLVIENKVFKFLSENYSTLTLPFNLPLNQVRGYLSHLKTDLPAIWQAFQVDENVSSSQSARETLSISSQEYAFYTDENLHLSIQGVSV